MYGWLIQVGQVDLTGVGKRMSLKITRSLISAVLEGKLDGIEMHKQEVFNLNIPTKCPGVPYETLNPRYSWADEKEYENTKIKLAKAFLKNF